MSVFCMVGFFVLNDGHRVMTPKLVNGVERNVYYIHYTSSIACSLGSSIPADIRIFSSTPDPSAIHPHGTVAFVSAKVQTPSDDGMAFLDAYYVVPFRGDVNDDFYQEPIPDLRYPLVFVIGHVTKMSKKDEIQDVRLRVGEYIRDAMAFSTVDAYYNTAAGRWKRAPVPYVGSCLHIMGVCAQKSENEPLRISVDNMSFNFSNVSATFPGGQQGVHLSPDSLSPGSSKRRRFEVVGPSTSPVASPSKSSKDTLRSPSIEIFEPSSSQLKSSLKSVEDVPRTQTPVKNTGNRRRSMSPLTEFSTPTRPASSVQEQEEEEPVFVPSPKKKSKGKGKGKGKERA
ncbi:hypothetical protein H0H92_003200 [Tricholoma furcatifolium]|nr:hypothetical protein H0H92_003200 [Tricholoma furcatifolium]